jgi:hypothetical protein
MAAATIFRQSGRFHNDLVGELLGKLALRLVCETAAPPVGGGRVRHCIRRTDSTCTRVIIDKTLCVQRQTWRRPHARRDHGGNGSTRRPGSARHGHSLFSPRKLCLQVFCNPVRMSKTCWVFRDTDTALSEADDLTAG